MGQKRVCFKNGEEKISATLVLKQSSNKIPSEFNNRKHDVIGVLEKKYAEEM